MATNHQRGYLRDNLILRAVEKCGVLDTEQIRVMFFSGIKNDRRMAQRRLQTLHAKRELQRGRLSVGHPYHYFLDARKQIWHRLGVNWAWIWLQKRYKAPWRLHCYIWEYDLKALRADALAAVRNVETGEFEFYFIEFDSAESGNEFDKVEKYNKVFEDGAYSKEWWVPLAKRFPVILVITTSGDRAKEIRRQLECENKNNLEFRLKLLQKIKEEAESV